MKYIYFLLCLVSVAANAQNKTILPATGNKNTLSHFTDGLFTDSVFMFRPSCGVPDYNVASYVTAKRWPILAADTCNAILYWYNPATQSWVSGGSGGQTGDTAYLNQGFLIQMLNVVNPDDSFYKPNGPNIVIRVDTAGLISFLNNYYTNITNPPDSANFDYFVFAIDGTPNFSYPTGTDVLVAATGTTGVFVGKENWVAKLVGASYTFPYGAPESGQQLLLSNDSDPDNTLFQSYRYNGTAWIRQAIPELVGGIALGVINTTGTTDNKAFIIQTNNRNRFRINPNGDLLYLKLRGTPTNNYMKIDSATGLMTYGQFKIAEYESPVNMDSVLYIENGEYKYGTATGGGSQNFNDVLQVQDVMPMANDNSVDFGDRSLDFNNFGSFQAFSHENVPFAHSGAYSAITPDANSFTYYNDSGQANIYMSATPADTIPYLKLSSGLGNLGSVIRLKKNQIYFGGIDPITPDLSVVFDTLKYNASADYSLGIIKTSENLDSLVKIPLSSGGGSSLFPTTGTGTATGNVTGELDAHNFVIQSGNSDRFGLGIFPTVGEESAVIKAPNDAHEVGAFFTSNTSDGYFWEINAQEDNQALIIGRGDDGTITHTANEHIFNGNTVFANNGTPGTGKVPIGTDGTGAWEWGTAGGGGFTRQVITSGSSGTVTGGNYIVTIDPASTLPAYDLTLPASPSDMDVVQVDFGGTLTSGGIVTSLTITPNSGQTIIDNTPPTSATADNTLQYRYRSSTSQWYRFKP